ncbi:MAG: segregation/condensation protein A [Candidatus Yonathbacteria bacterium]|nr:segregation/condensation protein A [Candidatus Yonathbacteria bacterium]
MEQTAYHVRTPAFEGPLELLLSLIEKRKVFVNDVSLADVADEYIAHVRGLSAFPLADAAGFLLVASTLALVKSRSLLPGLDISEEEKADIADLQSRLATYKRIVNLAADMRARFGKSILFAKTGEMKRTVVFAPDPSVDKETLVTSMRDIIRRFPASTPVLPKTTVRKIVSLEETIGRLANRIAKSLSMSFREFTGSREERVEVVVSFLALLELVKQGTIDVVQDERFGDILMESRATNVPRYE